MALEWILIGVVVIVILAVIYFYNHLRALNNQAQADWNQIDPLLQQRLDTIPNLIAMAKRVMKQETDLFTGLAAARESAAKAKTIPQKVAANQALGGFITSFMARAENYPELKSNQNMAVAMEQLAAIEDKIKYGRQRYGYTVQDYINACTLFPSSLFAGMFGFKAETWPYFKADEGARKSIDAAKLLKD